MNRGGPASTEPQQKIQVTRRKEYHFQARFLQLAACTYLGPGLTGSVDNDGQVQEHVEIPEKIVHALDRGVLGHSRLQRLRESVRDIPLEIRPALATLVHQLVAVLRGIFHHVETV